MPKTGLALACLSGLLGMPAALLSLFLLGMTVNGAARERIAHEEAGLLRSIEHRSLWGREGLCVYWHADGSIDLERSGWYRGDRRQPGVLSFERDAVGVRGPDGRVGPWLYLGEDGLPDRTRSGSYRRDRPIVSVPASYAVRNEPPDSPRPLDAQETEDLLRIWRSR